MHEPDQDEDRAMAAQCGGGTTGITDPILDCVDELVLQLAGKGGTMIARIRWHIGAALIGFGVVTLPPGPLRRTFALALDYWKRQNFEQAMAQQHERAQCRQPEHQA